MEDKKLGTLGRMKFEILTLIILSLILYFTPAEWLDTDNRNEKIAFLSLMYGKALFVNVGVIYAHCSRKILFPFLSFAQALMNRSWAVIVFLGIWYGTVIWAFARGG